MTTHNQEISNWPEIKEKKKMLEKRQNENVNLCTLQSIAWLWLCTILILSFSRWRQPCNGGGAQKSPPPITRVTNSPLRHHIFTTSCFCWLSASEAGEFFLHNWMYPLTRFIFRWQRSHNADSEEKWHSAKWATQLRYYWITQNLSTHSWGWSCLQSRHLNWRLV